MISVAIGIGCRKDTPAEAIVAVVRQALALLPEKATNARLYSSERKSREGGLLEASAILGFDLAFLSDDQLAAVATRLETRSAKVREITGLDGIAESAALAGAGPRAHVVVPRLTAGGAACAIAADAEESP